MRVALAQPDIRLGDIDGNVESATALIARAREQDADLIVFPELALSGYLVGSVPEDLSLEPTDDRIVALARAASPAALVLGYAERTRLHTYNSATYFQDGEPLHTHRKCYLPTYGVFEERKHFSPGGALRAFDSELGRQAVLVCNDAWQPALAFLAIQDAAQILIVPANSAAASYPGALDTRAYWRDITRFYGRMYQCFVVFVNRAGAEGELRFWGGSHVVAPSGEIIAEAAEHAEDLVVCEIDLAAVRARRREAPLVREARLALIAREVGRLLEGDGDL